jgi:hypothetical protein
MSVQHTPGPLFAGARENAIVVGSPQGTVLYRGSPAFTEGDARLYAAASDLLVALQALRLAREQDKHRSWELGVPNFKEAEALADAAIAKATGSAS